MLSGKIPESRDQRPLRRSYSTDDSESTVPCKKSKKSEETSVMPKRRNDFRPKQNRYIPKRCNATSQS